MPEDPEVATWEHRINTGRTTPYEPEMKKSPEDPSRRVPKCKSFMSSMFLTLLYHMRCSLSTDLANDTFSRDNSKPLWQPNSRYISVHCSFSRSGIDPIAILYGPIQRCQLVVSSREEHTWRPFLQEKGKTIGSCCWQCEFFLVSYPMFADFSTLFQHAMVIRFGLEANIIGMPRNIYEEIIAHHISGSNKNADKAANLRSFLIPERFKTNCSSSAMRTINILFAFVSDIWVWAIVDFVRLAQGHVISRDIFWDVHDFDTSSQVSVTVCDTYLLINEDIN